MIREEVKKLLYILSAAYPNTYKNMSKEQMKAQIELYGSQFKEYPVELVIHALQSYIGKNEYPPTVAGLKNEIRLISPQQDKQELWHELESACRKGSVFNQEDFDKLSKPLQEWLHSPRQVKELGMINSDTFQTVTRGQFMKTIGTVIEREEAVQSLPQNIKEMIEHNVLKLGDGNATDYE